MSTQHGLCARVTAMCVVGLTVSVELPAKDTDIYLKSLNPVDTTPNLLILFDTSDSMNQLVPNSRPPFDPATNYCAQPGHPESIRCDRVYWSMDGVPPGISGGLFGGNGPAHTQWFAASKNKCHSSAAALDSVGVYSGTKIAGFRSFGSGGGFFGGGSSTRGWVSLLRSRSFRFPDVREDAELTYVDCAADDEANDPLGQGYPRKNNLTPLTAYTSVAADEFAWASFNTNATPTLFSGQYLSYRNNPNLNEIRTRLAIAKEAMTSTIDANAHLRYGLMVFNSNDATGHGGRVILRAGPLDEILDSSDPANPKNRLALLKEKINALVASGTAPLSETLWEARNYLGGLAVQYGDAAGTPARDPLAQSNGVYVSPITDSCQQSFIVYITSGDPANDVDADDEIAALPNIGPLAGNRLDELAGWMHNNDVNASRPGSKVRTFTIGFGAGISDAGEQLLIDAASNGGGAYYVAENPDQLNVAIQQIVGAVLKGNASFASPSVSINAFNRAQHGENIYFSLFEPSPATAWDGNVKGYKVRKCVAADNCANGENDVEIFDATDKPATDSQNKILHTAVSYWRTTTDPDGGEIRAGGAGDRIPAPAERKLYTYLGSYDGLSATNAATSVAIAPAAGNALYNAAINDPTILGLTDTSGSPTTTNTGDTDRITTLIHWMRGDRDGDPATSARRWSFGDPLHSRPLIIAYGAERTDDALDPAKPIARMFVGTNDGVIRMINANTGAEEWAFIPSEFLGAQSMLSQNSDGDHAITVDGSPSAWAQDLDGDGVIEPEAGDRVYLYIGMRRGGRNIYAFDVTPTSTLTTPTDTAITPKLIWVIQGGTGEYTRLGQTWSTPQIAYFRLTSDGAPEARLFFAGGYDEHQDNGIPAGPDSLGNSVYVVNPLTGARLWWASGPGSQADLELPQMTYSIPSDLALLDVNGDDLIDRIYVGDTGGQLWRISFDIDRTASGYVLADVGCANGVRPDCDGTPEQDRRKFFYPPDVAQMEGFDVIAIGSGDREDPLDRLTRALTPTEAPVHNRVYAFKDVNFALTRPATDPAPLRDSNLKPAVTSDTNGWYFDLKPDATSWAGEKVTAAPLITDNKLFVSTFEPPNESAALAACVLPEGTARSRVFSLTGQVISDESEQVIGNGLPTEPIRLFLPNLAPGTVAVMVGVSGGMDVVTIHEPAGSGRSGSGNGAAGKSYWFQQ